MNLSQYMPEYSHLQKGFNLVELSIVLLIIGMVVSTVFVGQDLIQAQRLRNISVDISRITSAIHTFQLKYGAQPGDYALADTTFPGATSGNNDGAISLEDGDVFNHLYRARLIEADPPMPPISNSIYKIVSRDLTSFPNLIVDIPREAFAILLTNPNESNEFDWPLDGAEALTLDKKMDDGVGATGSTAINCNEARDQFSHQASCSTCTNDYTNYMIDSIKGCQQIYWLNGYWGMPRYGETD